MSPRRKAGMQGWMNVTVGLPSWWLWENGWDMTDVSTQRWGRLRNPKDYPSLPVIWPAGLSCPPPPSHYTAPRDVKGAETPAAPGSKALPLQLQ